MLYPHAYLTIIIPAIIAFAATLGAASFLEKYFYGAGIVGEDRNKARVVTLPGSGGVAVAFGIIAGILAYTFGGTFLFSPLLSIDRLLATALSILLISFVGFLDDINVKARRVKSTDMLDIREGLKQWQKPLLTAIGAMPLIAINAGVSSINIPLIGVVNLGLLYPLLILPLAVVFVSNSFNLLGGFDGMQPGMGMIASLGFLLYSAVYGNGTGLLISAILLTALLAFYPFNKYPARILPGDSLTYCIGGTLVAIMVMGNAESFGAVIFMPWIIEFILHLRRGFKVTDLGIRRRDGTMKPPYGKKIYSLTHLVMNMKDATEKEVALYLSALEVLFVLLAFALKFAGLL